MQNEGFLCSLSCKKISNPCFQFSRSCLVESVVFPCYCCHCWLGCLWYLALLSPWLFFSFFFLFCYCCLLVFCCFCSHCRLCCLMYFCYHTVVVALAFVIFVAVLLLFDIPLLLFFLLISLPFRKRQFKGVLLGTSPCKLRFCLVAKMAWWRSFPAKRPYWR